MTKILYVELKSLLSRDFLADNLRHAATLCHEASWNEANPLGLFVIAQVLRIMEQQWDVEDLRDQAWMAPQALAFMEQSLRAPLLNYLDSAAMGHFDAAAEIEALNEIIHALFRWTALGPAPRG